MAVPKRESHKITKWSTHLFLLPRPSQLDEQCKATGGEQDCLTRSCCALQSSVYENCVIWIWIQTRLGTCTGWLTAVRALPCSPLLDTFTSCDTLKAACVYMLPKYNGVGTVIIRLAVLQGDHFMIFFTQWQSCASRVGHWIPSSRPISIGLCTECSSLETRSLSPCRVRHGFTVRLMFPNISQAQIALCGQTTTWLNLPRCPQSPSWEQVSLRKNLLL